MHMPPPFMTISSRSRPCPLTSFCPKSLNHPQHIQFNSNYHHLMFYGDRMATKVDIYCTTLSFDLLISKSNQFIIDPKCTKVVNLVKFLGGIYKISCLQTSGCTHTHTDGRTSAYMDNPKTLCLHNCSNIGEL